MIANPALHLVLLSAVSAGSPSDGPPLRDPLHTVDGCHGGRIVAPLVPLWDRHPAEGGSRRIGWLRGTHRRALCEGTVIAVRERLRDGGRVYVRVETVAGASGWISEGFVGTVFPRWKCEWRFEGEAVERCRDL